MSVNLSVRRVGSPLLRALCRSPELTAALCNSSLDFDPQAFERDFLEATPPERREAGRALFETRRRRMLGYQQDAQKPLLAAGLGEGDIGPALSLGRSWWGMETMINDPIGRRIIAEDEGEAIGDDVGYGPARLFSPPELSDIVAVLEGVTVRSAEPRYRVQEAAHRADQSARGFDVPPVCTETEFQAWSWEPFCALRGFVRATVEADAWLLRWYD